jgi:hypothetical protein
MLLDALWSRTKETVDTNASSVNSALYGILHHYLPKGPLPDFDHCDYGVVLQILAASREPERHHADRQQFDSIQCICTAYTNQVRSSAFRSAEPMALEENQGKKDTFIAQDHCASLWFDIFMEVCTRRMGQDVSSNRALSAELMNALHYQRLNQAREAG